MDQMRCLSCMAENAPATRFCAECGMPLPASCPGCGFDNEPAARLCGGCGRPLPEVAAPKQIGVPRPDGAQRRQLTVMFCDLVGLTALASRLDPEDVREVLGAYHESIANKIAHFDGFLARYMCDCGSMLQPSLGAAVAGYSRFV